MRTWIGLSVFLWIAACGDATNSTPMGGAGNGNQATDCSTSPCEVSVNDAALIGCESDSGTPTVLNAVVNERGEIEVEHFAVKSGCCPTFSAQGTYDVSTSVIAVDYTFKNDQCDCICALDVAYTIADVPSGDWTLETENGAQAVSIP